MRRAVWECDSYKSSGPDGVNFSFVKEFWETINENFIRVLSEFHLNGHMVKGENKAFIVLIPNRKNIVKPSDFRPISHIGCIYKVIEKVLENRLKKVFGKIISETQSTFLFDRQILHGILIAKEIMDEARRKNKEVHMFKVDFEKSYDLVDWNFLDYVMAKIGFHEKWRRWIAEFLKSTSNSVLVNGSPTDEFGMGQGLRQ